MAIPDGSGSTGAGAPATITINVPAAYTSVIDTSSTNFTFDLNINHTWVGDLIVTLTSPAGSTVTLMDRPGRPPSTYGCGRNNIDATFDDGSGTPVENECATPPAIGGTLNPTGTLNDFDGELPAGDWTLTVTDNAGQDTGTIISASNCMDFITVPIVLSSFVSKSRGNRLKTKWQTSSEAFNLGFNVWGKIEGDWSQLNRKMIRSRNVDSVEPEVYRKSFNLNRLSSPPTEIGISSVSTSGMEEFFGPFVIGERYGEITVPSPINWTEQRKKHQDAMTNAGFEYKNHRWKRTTKRSKNRALNLAKRFPDGWLNIKEGGVYRVTYEELKDGGLDYKNLPVRALALSHAGQPLPRFILGSKNNKKRFGPGAEIIFYANAPTDRDARYADNKNIRVSADSSKALKALRINKSSMPYGTTPSNVHQHTIQFGAPNEYSFILPGGSGWYDEIIYAFGQNGSKLMNFSLDETVNLESEAKITAELMGGISFNRIDRDGDGRVEPNHHFKVYLNRARFADPIYEGYANGINSVKIEAFSQGQLLLGENTLEIAIIPDNGHNIDAMYFVGASIDIEKHNTDVDGLSILPLFTDQDWISITSRSNIDRVFAYDDEGNFSELFRHTHPLDTSESSILVQAPPSSATNSNRYIWLSGSDNYLSVANIESTTPVNEDRLNLDGVDYVIIAAPSLINEKLRQYAKQKTDAGLTTKIVNTYDIYNTFSDGVETPYAISSYLKRAARGSATLAPSPFKYVLLVGGHTYNYRGYSTTPENRPINHLPSFYRNGSGTMNRQIPTAVPFVDFDDDQVPDRAIGRWPVRNQDQLNYVIDKTIEWNSANSNRQDLTTLFIAQQDESFHRFADSLERLETYIGHRDLSWNLPSKIYLNDIFADGSIPNSEKLGHARTKITDEINKGPALTIYNGHGSPTSWGKQNLITTSTVDNLTNRKKPTLIIPLACYTTYFETPNVKSLSERLFTDNPAGAVGLIGPSLLSFGSSNERFAKTLLKLITQQGLDVGTAVLKAKQGLSNAGPNGQTAIFNWSTLVDPTLSFGLPAAALNNETSEHAARKLGSEKGL